MINWYLLISAILVWSIVYLLDRETDSINRQLDAREIFKYLGTIFCIALFIVSIVGIILSLLVPNDGTITYVCAVIIIGLLVLLCYIQESKKEQARRAKLFAWAELHGWSYDYDRDCRSSYLSFFDRLDRGSNRYIFDVLRGKWGRYSADAFNFHYEIEWDDKSSTTEHHFGVVLIYLDKAFFNLKIKPRDILSFGGIQFELIEFNKKFKVASNETRFAYDFCHPRLIEYLLEQKNIDLELKENVLALFIDCDRLVVEDIEYSLDRLIHIRELMPNYLYRS